jgi:hypothetical protein
VHVAFNGKYAGNIVIADKIKEDSYLAIKNSKRKWHKTNCYVNRRYKNSRETVAEELESIK